LCDVVDEVLEEFDRSGLTDLFGKDAFFLTPATVVEAFHESSPVL
jgi:hypothetical protein